MGGCSKPPPPDLEFLQSDIPYINKKLNSLIMQWKTTYGYSPVQADSYAHYDVMV